MNYDLRLRPELLDDVSEAYTWYEKRATGLGEEFLRTFYAAAARIQRNPNLFHLVYSDYRRLYLRRFPYFVYYRIEDRTVILILLFHCARNPRAMRREIRTRQTGE